MHFRHAELAALTMTTAPLDVAVVRGGGVLVAAHLLAQSGESPPRIAIVEPRAQLAQGAPYATPYPSTCSMSSPGA